MMRKLLDISFILDFGRLSAAPCQGACTYTVHAPISFFEDGGKTAAALRATGCSPTLFSSFP